MDLFLVFCVTEQFLKKHERCAEGCAKLMRDSRGVTLESLVSILLFEELGLEPQLLNVICHVLEEHSDGGLASVVDLLGSYVHVLFL